MPVLERAQQNRADAAQRARAETDLADRSVRVITAPAWSDPAAKSLGWNVRCADGKELTPSSTRHAPGTWPVVVQEWVTVDADCRVYTELSAPMV